MGPIQVPKAHQAEDEEEHEQEQENLKGYNDPRCLISTPVDYFCFE